MSKDLMEKIDDWMFDAVFQRFAHWFQGMTGRDNFFLTRCLIVTSFVIQTAHRSKDMTLVGASMPNLFVLGLGFFAVWLVESHVRRNLGDSLTMNRWRKDPFVSSIRELLLLFTAYSIVSNMYGSIVDGQWSLRILLIRIGDISQMYLLSCTPLPPGDSKFKKWLASLKEKFSGPLPVPQPT